jgi:hypothetical protein
MAAAAQALAMQAPAHPQPGRPAAPGTRAPTAVRDPHQAARPAGAPVAALAAAPGGAQHRTADVKVGDAASMPVSAVESVHNAGAAQSDVQADAANSVVQNAAQAESDETGRNVPTVPSDSDSRAHKRLCTNEGSNEGTDSAPDSSDSGTSVEQRMPSQATTSANVTEPASAVRSAAPPASELPTRPHTTESVGRRRGSSTVGAVCVDSSGRVASGVSSRLLATERAVGELATAAQYRCGAWAQNARPGHSSVGASSTGQAAADIALAESACRSVSSADSSEDAGQVRCCLHALHSRGAAAHSEMLDWCRAGFVWRLPNPGRSCVACLGRS